jgi:hypothetical protein
MFNDEVSHIVLRQEDSLTLSIQEGQCSFFLEHHHQSMVNIEIGPNREKERERENDGGPCVLLIETKTESYTNTYSEYRLDANSQYKNHIYIQFLSSCFCFPEKKRIQKK